MEKIIKLLLFIVFIMFISNGCSNDSFINEFPTGENTESTSDDTKGSSDEKVIFEDNFNQVDKIPDNSKWTVYPKRDGQSGWCKYASGSYDQAYVENGNMVLKAEKINGEYKIGAVWTKNKIEFTYGRVEVRAKFTEAQGGWPAIWMIPNPNSEHPYEGEIDIMEKVSHKVKAVQTVHSHYTYDLGYTDPMSQFSTPYNVNEYNTYSIDWTPEKIVFYVNGKITFSYPNLHLSNEETMRQWPFNKPYYIILNYALGGSWAGTIDDSELPATMHVDWVKVTQKI